MLAAGSRALEDMTAERDQMSAELTQAIESCNDDDEVGAMVITGAGRGLGRAYALLLAARGARVVVNDPGASMAGEGTDAGPAEQVVQTPWLKIDDVFFEARGTAWALLHFFRAVEFDFSQVLADKNAQASVRQIIRELEASLEPMRWPMVLNGGGYGLTANHSLVMANFLARANAAVINLRELLDQG